MIGNYLGELSRDDPLYGYLRNLMAQEIGASSKARYGVFKFTYSQNVYLYVGENGEPKLVGKFFKSSNPDHARNLGESEFNNLIYLRSLGFSKPPHHVVKPYGFNPAIDNLLLTEYVTAESLSSIVNSALHQDKHNRLFRKLSALGHFLANLHNRTAGEWTVNFDESLNYMGQLLKSLMKKWGVPREHCEEFFSLREAWGNRGFMREDRAVLVHGDATPSNLLFGRGQEVIAIDLERMKWSDRVFDLGRLCGELAHFFFQSTGNRFAAEPFIGHFLWEYCGHFPNREDAFHSITRRLPFYMGITLLRVARNSWIDADYRWRLIGEARQILRAQT
jgi:thiamine kinase-like enzyme